jgi:hypothetical protein
MFYDDPVLFAAFLAHLILIGVGFLVAASIVRMLVQAANDDDETPQ